MDPQIAAAWNQRNVPVIWRTGRPPILLRLPFDKTNRAWIQNGRRNSPTWKKAEARWEIPAAWFNDTVNRGLQRWGRMYIIQPYREQEKCAPACRNAEGHECECSCMGANHGAGGGGGWFDVSDAFSTRWGPQQIACRLLTLRP